MRFLRRQLGARGEDSTTRGFARELEVHYSKLHSWERRGNFPRGGLEELATAFARLPIIKERGLDPAKIANWAYTGDGPPPISATQPRPVGPELPHAGAPSARAGATEKTPSGGVVIDQRTPIPWRMLHSLAELGKKARDTGNAGEEDALREEFIQLVRTLGIPADQPRSPTDSEENNP
jgi:hypothetical protein